MDEPRIPRPARRITHRALRLAWPTPWTDYFNNTNPLAVEIGFGNGSFLAALAKTQPSWNYIGIERAHSPLTWTEKRIRREKLHNVQLIHGDAFMVLQSCFSPESVATFHINFSDPWPKQRHRQRRLIDADFLEILVSRLAINGSLHIATDIHSYAKQISKALTNTLGLSNAYPTDWASERENPLVVTSYEQKALAADRDRYYFRWQRNTEPIAHIPVTQEVEMPNAALQLPFGFETIEAAFEPFAKQHQDRIVSFKSLLRDIQYPTLLFDIFVDENLHEQRVLLMLKARQSGDYAIRYAQTGFPRATPGLHDAVHYLVEWLKSLHPDVVVTTAAYSELDS